MRCYSPCNGKIFTVFMSSPIQDNCPIEGWTGCFHILTVGVYCFSGNLGPAWMHQGFGTLAGETEQYTKELEALWVTTMLLSHASPSDISLFWMYEKVKVLVAQSCPTLCNPMDYSLPGSSVHGMLQASILEWVAIPFSRGSSQPRERTQCLMFSTLAGRFLTTGATWEAPKVKRSQLKSCRCMAKTTTI